jgi:WD40 repeat protein
MPRNPKDSQKTLFQKRLAILHTFLCTTEPTSTAVVTQLLGGQPMANAAHPSQHESVADHVLRQLHAVLYNQGGQVMSFHKSFSDFIFDEERSQEFYCDQGSHHRSLAERCFDIMLLELHFNMADIPDSSVFDTDNPALQASVEQNIRPALRYASKSWSQHLTSGQVLDSAKALETLHDFLQLPVLFWMETMNLLGLREHCDKMLRKSQDWMSSTKVCLCAPEHSMCEADFRSQKLEGLTDQLSKAAAFAVYFSASPAASSTPHLYLSSLATFPFHTDLLRTWRTRFRDIPAFTNQVNHGSTLMTLQVKSGVRGVAVSPDGSLLATGSMDGTVRVWNLSTGEKLKTLEGHSKNVNSVAFSPDSSCIVSGSDDKTVQVWDASSGEHLKTLEGHSTGRVTSVAFSPDGRRIVSGSYNSTVRVWDASSGKLLKTLRVGGHSSWVLTVLSVAFSPDGRRIVSGSNDNTVRVWDGSSGEQLKTLEGHSGTVYSVAFSLDGKRIVSGSYDKTVRVWDASSGGHLKTLEGHSSMVSSVAFSPDSRRIISGSHDKTVRVWDASSREHLKTLTGHSSRVMSVASSPDGRRIVSGSDDNTVRVWDASSGEQLKTFEGHSDMVRSAAFSPDGRHIVSRSWDNTVRVWDASSGEQLKTLEGHNSNVNSVAFSLDGKRIVSGSIDKTARVWLAPDPSFVERYTREQREDGFTGWLLSPHSSSAYLMFVPLDENLPDDSNILTIPRTAVSYVDFSEAKLGTQWAQCYTPMAG